MKTLNHDEPYITLFGLLPLRYVQNGYGYSNAGRLLGRYDDNGKRIDEPAAAQSAPEPAGEQDADAEEEFSDDEKQEICEIVAAIEAMDRDDESLWTATGRPKIGAVRALVDREVSVRCLNQAMNEVGK